MRISRPSDRGMAEGDMTPMIDMTFQLIAFFMVLLNFSDVEQAQEVNLPSSELAKPPEVAYDEPLTIQLTRQDIVLFGGERLTLDQLQPALLNEAQIIRAHPDKRVGDVMVIIRADKAAPTGKVQEIIEKCQAAEFDRFALRGRQSDVSTLRGDR